MTGSWVQTKIQQFKASATDTKSISFVKCMFYSAERDDNWESIRKNSEIFYGDDVIILKLKAQKKSHHFMGCTVIIPHWHDNEIVSEILLFPHVHLN